MLEMKVYLNAISLAQTLINAEKDNFSAVTPALISEKVDLAISLLKNSTETIIDRDKVISELVRRSSSWIGQDSTLFDTTGHKDWLSFERKNDWRYWHRYSEYLERKMASTAVEALDKSTDSILGLLEDPKREGNWDRRGLVVGHVQSGKTGNYSGLICKAADAGYKIIIVLAGMHNNLRSQTQVRLEESFLGYETPLGDAVKLIGVGEIDSDSKILPNCATNRSDKGDFNAKVAMHYAISPEERPWLFVVKKNKSVLERLLKWIKGHVADSTDSSTGRRFVSNLPLLVIDDEADHASVDTGEQLFDLDGNPDEDHEPKAINSRIRKILFAFSKSAYVGYTATPFANIFIHRKNATKEEGPDLFPQSFIINLAAPSNYIGPSKIFGYKSKEGRKNNLALDRSISDFFDATTNTGWMPPKHSKNHSPLINGVYDIPESLKQAVFSFILACTERHLRGQGREHSSMLIHVTRFNLVQKDVYDQVDGFLSIIKRKVLRSIDHENLLSTLKELWELDFIQTSLEISNILDASEAPPPPSSWQQIAETLPIVLADIEVKMINGTAKDALDYESSKEKGLKLIAIGGDKLARGLTLEGLCTSYFIRTTKMYDTLMQMGRWFGYRPRYIDLCRLYTTNDLIEWFGHITDASEELREEFDQMVESGGTPLDYGLKVQSHSVLMVTSPLKMRSAETLFLSYSGSLVQTVSMFKEPQLLEINLRATEKLLEEVGHPSEIGPTRERLDKPDKWEKSFLWKSVNSKLIIEFLESFKTHPKATRANSLVLADFIKLMNSNSELETWTVALLGEGKPSHTPYSFGSGLTITSMPYRSDTKVEGSYSIGVLTDPADEAIDLDDDVWKKALELTQSEWKPDPARNRLTLPTRPSGKKIRDIRGLGKDDIPANPNSGILLLYPLSPFDDKGAQICNEWEKPIIAFAISFPSSNSGTKVEYKVDHLLWKEEYGAAD